MSTLICTTCDRPFDTDLQVDAEYMPLPKCEECIDETRRHEESTPRQVSEETSRTSAETMVRGSNQSISKGLGRI